MNNITQTSLIPTTLSLLKFYNENGFSSFFQNYPFWYKGEVPFKYLIGPITPLLLNYDLLLNNLTYIVLLSLLISILSWSFFISLFFKINRSKIFVISLFLSIIFPWKYIYAFSYSDLTLLFAKSFIPFYLIFFYKNQKIFSIISLVILLLINTSVLPSVIIFSLALCVNNYKKRLKYFLIILITSLIAVTLWYGPFYFLRIFSNPSIGGKMGIETVFGILNYFKILLPFILAFLSVKFSGKLTKRLPVFILVSFISFFILTLYRFFANPEFYLDFLSWFYEFEIATCLLSVYAIYKNKYKYLLIFIPILIICILFAYKTQFKAFDMKNPSLDYLEEISNGKIVFMSGASVFTPSKIVQIRGGRDEVSKNKDWLDASYILRESKDVKLIRKSLKLLNISYVLVHTKSTKDFYKDFKNEEVWGELGELVKETDGDKIYKVD